MPKIVAIDLPSGWDSDSTSANQSGLVFPADAVITFTAPKPAHVFGQLTRSLFQPIVVAPIGSPDQAIVSSLSLHWSGALKAIADPERPADSNKGMYGHVLVIGGSQGKSGAPAMASLAALRTGAGLVTAAVAPSVLPLVAAIAPELMTQALATTLAGEISPENLAPGALKSLLKGITVIAIGPGLGTSPEAIEFAIGLLTQSRLSAVADADALNALSKHPELISEIAKGRTLVLTPHPGEMSRLVGLTIADIQANRIEIAREFATKHQLTLVLKGWRTLIAHPDGSIGVNTTGNPGMAKGGSGDLLTGIVAAMLSQHPKSPAQAVEAAVYLHGLAADITVRQPGIGGDQHTLLATDSLANLHRAFRFHPQAHSGYGWLQGLPSDFLL
jgi:NAD(P)H-hydrate epimerase